jgi:hypothetical protein
MKPMPIARTAVAAFALLASLGVAHAASPSLNRAFGNTIESTYPDGRQAELWLAPDGSYRAEGRRGDESSGTWRLRGERMCLSQHRPFPSPFSYCTPVPSSMEHGWSARAVTGEHIRVALLRGRVTGHKGQPH